MLAGEGMGTAQLKQGIGQVSLAGTFKGLTAPEGFIKDGGIAINLCQGCRGDHGIKKPRWVLLMSWRGRVNGLAGQADRFGGMPPRFWPGPAEHAGQRLQQPATVCLDQRPVRVIVAQ